MSTVVETAIETLGAALAGSGRPLVVAAGTLGLTPGRLATEEDFHDRNLPTRLPSEEAALAMVSRGVRASVVRLPPSVHDQVKQGLVRFMIEIARKKGISAYAGDGLNRWPAVHRLDATRVFTLALENGSAGARYHAVAEEGIPLRDIAEVIGRRLNVRVISKSAAHFGFLAPFVSIDNPTSSRFTQERLGWRPIQPELIPDLDRVSRSDRVSEQSVVAPPSLAAAFIGEPQQYSAIALCGRVDFAALGELRQSVRARGLEEPQARLGVTHIRRYERFRYELRHLVDNLAARETLHRRPPPRAGRWRQG